MMTNNILDRLRHRLYITDGFANPDEVRDAIKEIEKLQADCIKWKSTADALYELTLVSAKTVEEHIANKKELPK